VTWFWFGASGTKRSQISVSGNTISWDGSGNGGVLVYGVSGPGAPRITGGTRAGFQILRNGQRIIDESLFGWHMIARGTASSNISQPPFFVPHNNPNKPPLIAIESQGKVAVLSIVPVTGGSNVKLLGNVSVNWYAFAEIGSGNQNYGRGIGVRWFVNGTLAGDTSVPSLRMVATNIVYSAGGFSNGNNNGDQLLEIYTIPPGRRVATVISDPGFHFDSSGNGMGSGQTTTKCVGTYQSGNKLYAQGTVYSTTPGGGAAPIVNAPGLVHVVDVTGFDQF
jgi:hypothetical protein